MRARWIPCLALFLAVPLAAQQRPSPEEMMRRKLQAPFLRHVDWARDLETARARAAEREQLIFGYFTTAGP